MNYPDALIRDVLLNVQTIALVGASPRPNRPSNGVMRFLLDKGYTVWPVNPACAGDKIHGCTVVSELTDLKDVPDMVDIFRRSSEAGAVADEAVAIGIKTIWMQLDIIDHEASKRAEDAGATVIMDRCPVIEYRRQNIQKQS